MNQAAFNLYSEPGDRYTRVQDAEVGLHHKDPSATELAGALYAVETSGQQKVDLLRAYVNADWRGLTDWEMHHETRLQMSSINSRRNTLVRRGWVEDSGRRRPSPVSRLDVIVWIVTTPGKRALAGKTADSSPEHAFAS